MHHQSHPKAYVVSCMPAVLCCSTPACTSLLAALPGLGRLTAARKAELQQVFPRLRLLLQLLPGGSAALRRHSQCEAWSSFVWAYGTAKTRTTTLSTEAALSINSKASSSSHNLDDPPGAVQSAASPGLHLSPTALQRAAGKGLEGVDYGVAWLRTWVIQARAASSAAVALRLEQLDLVGALVPVLDLANHGSGAEVRATTPQHSNMHSLLPHPRSSCMQHPLHLVFWKDVFVVGT
jgi:hypothetical protein